MQIIHNNNEDLEMTGVVLTRLDEKEIEELNQISEKERIDRSAFIRKFLLTQIEEYRLKEVSENYRKGFVSLAETSFIVKQVFLQAVRRNLILKLV